MRRSDIKYFAQSQLVNNGAGIQTYVSQTPCLNKDRKERRRRKIGQEKKKKEKSSSTVLYHHLQLTAHGILMSLCCTHR